MGNSFLPVAPEILSDQIWLLVMPGVSTTKSLYLKTMGCCRDFLLLHQMLSYIPLLFSSQVSEEHFIIFHVLLKAIFRLFFFQMKKKFFLKMFRTPASLKISVHY